MEFFYYFYLLGAELDKFVLDLLFFVSVLLEFLELYFLEISNSLEHTRLPMDEARLYPLLLYIHILNNFSAYGLFPNL
jgi:hypothetical protein